MLLTTGRWITPTELPANMLHLQETQEYFGQDETLSIKQASRQLQRNLIEKALKKSNNNRSKAARMLEISRPMLLSKIKEFGLE